jgi:hypothetical protein
VHGPRREMRVEERGTMKMGSLGCPCALNTAVAGSHADVVGC